MQLNPYLMFNGQCEAAIKFYEQSLGAKVQFITRYSDAPAGSGSSPDVQDKIMHARISVAGQTVMASDAPCDRYDEPKGFFVSINVTDPAEAERIYAALSEGGKVSMPLGETFWALRFAMFSDRFGTPWMINCEKPA
jgi:PhnB protein